MKKLLTAFTLAEILITLGIVGVIARVTLPSLMSNVGKQQAEASFAKSINSLETGILKLQQETGINDVVSAGTSLCNRSDTSNGRLAASIFLEGLSYYMNATYMMGEYRNINGTSKSVPILTTKDGISYYGISGLVTSKNRNKLPEKYNGEALEIIIDINATTKPNKYGVDQFVVYIDKAGLVIPNGGYQWSEFNDFENRDEQNNVDWISGCGTSKSKPSKPEACAGSIVDNGFKIIYGFKNL